MMSIPVDVQHRSQTLTQLLVEDVTTINNGVSSPAINLVAVTLER